MHPPRARQDIPRVLHLSNRAPMAEHNNVLADPNRRIADLLHQRNAVIEALGRLRADAPARRKPHVRNNDIRAGPRHLNRLRRIEHVRRRKHVQSRRSAHHLDLVRIPHAALLQPPAKRPINEPHRREVLHATKPQRLQLPQEPPAPTARAGIAERVGGADPREHGSARDDGQDLARHLEHGGVGVPVRHEPRERAAPRHAEAPRVVDDDEIGAAGLGGLGREPDAGARADDGLLGGDGGAEAREELGARDRGHGLFIGMTGRSSRGVLIFDFLQGFLRLVSVA